MPDELKHVLDEIECYLEDCQDVRDGSDGQQLPNRAMTLLMDLRLARQSARPEAALTWAAIKEPPAGYITVVTKNLPIYATDGERWWKCVPLPEGALLPQREGS